MTRSIAKEKILPLIKIALKEDIGSGDVTTGAIFSPKDRTQAYILSKEKGIFCGGSIIRHIYSVLDASIKITVFKKDGEQVSPGEKTADISGSTRNILMGERTVLNFMQRMSGIATRTRDIADLLKGTGIKILDTRKTLPGFRDLDKYSVKAGGGENHRHGLYDMILIKDNHIKAAGGITNAVNMVKKAYGKKYKIEVEASNLEEVREAASLGTGIIMLDNMDNRNMQKAIDIINGRTKIEVSGNISEKRIKNIRHLKIDYISMGALTHSVKAFDLSMKFM